MIVYAASKIIPRYISNPYDKERVIKLHSTDKLPMRYFIERDECIAFIYQSEEKLVMEEICVNEEQRNSLAE